MDQNSLSPHPTMNLGTHTWWEPWKAQASLTHHWEGGGSPRETKWAWSVLVQKNNTDWQIAACLHLTSQGNPPAFSGGRHRRKGKGFYDIFERVNRSKIWLAKKMGGGSSWFLLMASLLRRNPYCFHLYYFVHKLSF